jgi:pimeloyl-ACP methyl ester carboxylesterase
VLLVGGWPQTWYAWRGVMPILARDRHVIVAEARGFGRSDKPLGSYDVGTVAGELVALMDVLGHSRRFDFVGHDVGAWIGFAMAADRGDRVARAVLIDAAIPGVSPPPSVMAPQAVNTRVWHFGFNRLGPELNEALVRGREDEFFGWQFRNKSASPGAMSDSDIAVYVKAYRDPETLRAGFDYYRAIEIDIAQNAERLKRKLEMPVLLVAGEKGVGQSMLDGLAGIAMHVSGRVLTGIGHYVPDEAPEALAEVLLDYLRIGSPVL